VREILARHGRQGDYVEVALDSEFRYNPLHNDLKAYALAYGIASLLNNLFGRGKEPFWQQAYTNLVKFIRYPFEKDPPTNEMKAAISVELLRFPDTNRIPYSGDGNRRRPRPSRRAQAAAA